MAGDSDQVTRRKDSAYDLGQAVINVLTAHLALTYIYQKLH